MGLLIPFMMCLADKCGITIHLVLISFSFRPSIFHIPKAEEDGCNNDDMEKYTAYVSEEDDSTAGFTCQYRYTHNPNVETQFRLSHIRFVFILNFFPAQHISWVRTGSVMMMSSQVEVFCGCMKPVN